MTTVVSPDSVEQRFDELKDQLQQISRELRTQREQRQKWQDLMEDLAPITSPVTVAATDVLQTIDDRGYFSFARQAAGVIDNVVTSFSEEDVRLLGDNIVLILQTVKQMTQPEVMTLLGRTALTIQEGETDGSTEVPSTIGLLKQLHDPQVRRGLARVLATLRAIGAEALPINGGNSDGSSND